jgi:pyruvate-ferredoxin/flavodoxin oxidoreductase
MGATHYKTLDGNEAVARIAYLLNEVIAIYPITPSSPMGEWADAWAAAGQPNLWGHVPSVIEMQSEAGAAGAVHGALQTGSLTTTFTASQGLMLMLPNMYKIAGELTPTVFHIAARSLATQALSIFGDHSDVMAARSTGWAMLCSGSVQEAQDFALISHLATLASRIPFLHFFDGFRTSHEVAKIALLEESDLQALLKEEWLLQFRERALTPDAPSIRGTAHNPDTYFQARETVNQIYAANPDLVQELMDQFAHLTGRAYQLYEYVGAPDAERVIIIMGSGAETAHEALDYLNAQGERVGLLKVRLFRPWDDERLIAALPKTVKHIAVLDRTKEPGSAGEPLYLDVVKTLYEFWESPDALPVVIGGRYGLSSKEFTPAMVKGIYDELATARPKNHFTIGIEDDVTHSSLSYDSTLSTEPEEVIRAIFYGLGSDGTVGANKNSIKIIGENTDHSAQGYFVYDSKKSGSVTVSHLRFGTDPIRSSYLINQANFVACHQPIFLERYDILESIQHGGTFLLNTYLSPECVWESLPRPIQQEILEKELRLFVIDGYKVAKENGMGPYINTVMQVCFFAISNVLPREESIAAIKDSIRETYAKKGEIIVEKNLRAVDSTLENLFEVTIPSELSSAIELLPPVADSAPVFVKDILGRMIARQGDSLPVSALPIDGVYPSGTAQYEKRNLAQEIPVWDPQVCIQCAKCAMVCPHAVIRIKAYEPAVLDSAPETFKSTAAKDWGGLRYTIQVSPEDCTACGICVDVCPAKNKSAAGFKAINMQPQAPLREAENANWDFFMQIPDLDRREIKISSIRQQQVQRPLFEFSGACAGCGETPYLKLVSQLFGDRTVIANATGCSSIYGGNLPTTPWTFNHEGRGPAWANSLFEDNAEFGLGMRVSLDQQAQNARALLASLGDSLSPSLIEQLLNNPQSDEADIQQQREWVAALKSQLAGMGHPSAVQLLSLADQLVRKTVWIVGGDGWAYDIGYGGLDHVFASGRNVNILVLDTEVYSNTGGQASKSTPRAAVAKFASGGKLTRKKDLGLMAMSYGAVYVAQVAMGAKDEHTLRAFLEAEAYPGVSLIIAYSHCIAHGINMTTAMTDQKAAVDSGYWPLYRYHPGHAAEGKNPFTLDSRAPKGRLDQYMYSQNRFKMLTKSDPQAAKDLLQAAQEDVTARLAYYEYLANRPFEPAEETAY